MHTLLHTVSPTLQQATTNPHLHQGLLDTHGQVWVSLLWGHCSLFLGPGAQGSVCSLQECFLSPVMFWRLYGKVNGDLLQEALCHTQVCCTQSPCPCSSPLLTCTSTGDTQTQFYLSLWGGVSGSWCAQGMFEPSEHLWKVWGLSLNVILLLLPSCWGFSFALGRGVSPHSCSSAM